MRFPIPRLSKYSVYVCLTDKKKRGANWIHGAGDNLINQLAQATSTQVHEFTTPAAVITRSGQMLESQKATQTSSIIWKTIDEAYEYSRRLGTQIPADRSLFDFIRERVGVQQGLSTEEKDECLEFSRVWGSYVGDAVERQSLRFFWLEECLDESVAFVASTYRGILRLLARESLECETVDIRYNTPVLHVQTDPSQGQGQGQGRIKLTTQDGIYAFDHVVVTCPLGWLKRNKAAFTPSLPARLTQAIDNISYGRLEKVYITFPEAFWREKTVTATATATTTVFQDPIYTASPTTSPWNQDCMALDSLPDSQAHPTLLFYLYGENATEVVQRIAHILPGTKEYYKILDNLFRPFYARLPGFNASSESCTPCAFRATSWQTDEFAGYGSYSNFQVGLQAGDADLAVFRDSAGLGKERGVWFAGEHTASVEALGTTSGAYSSGQRVADSISP